LGGKTVVRDPITKMIEDPGKVGEQGCIAFAGIQLSADHRFESIGAPRPWLSE
jgi:hypothetical protein